MKQHNFESNGNEFLMVEVQEDGFNFGWRVGQMSYELPNLKPNTYKMLHLEDIKELQGEEKILHIIVCFTPRTNEIDFEVSDSMVNLLVHQKSRRNGIAKVPEIKLYQNYKYDLPQPVDFTFTTAKHSFLSLLQSEAGKVWVNKNPYVSKKYPIPVSSELTDFLEAESKLMPEKLLIIKIERK